MTTSTRKRFVVAAAATGVAATAASVIAAAAEQQQQLHPPTIGMRLDDAIASISNACSSLLTFEDMSSTQLYALTVGLTVVISFVLLGSPKPTEIVLSEQQQQQQQQSGRSSATSKSSVTVAVGPEPQWHIFCWFNYAIAILFLWSVVEFCYHADDYYKYRTDSLLFFLLLWSVFLCYFFGFFGVSFVHNVIAASSSSSSSTDGGSAKSAKGTNRKGAAVRDDNDEREGTKEEHKNNGKAVAASEERMSTTAKKSATQQQQQQPKKKPLHPPAISTPPICSDTAPVRENRKKLIHAASSISASSAAAPAKALPTNLAECTDREIAQLVLSHKMKDHELEKRLDAHRAVSVRRCVVQDKLETLLGTKESTQAIEGIPHENGKPALDYSKVYGANCEIVIGYLPLPVGLVGPLTVNDETVYVPMATTEGCLVASTNRGAKAITAGGGAHAHVIRDAITRAPCVRMPSASDAARLAMWVEVPSNFERLKRAFESTTSFGKLLSCKPTVAGRNVYLRLSCFSGDAMGMNMVSKGSLAVMDCLKQQFPDLKLVALSGNMCTDKKAAATNWLEGRGKSVVVEATIPADIVRSVLKTSVQALVDVNINKNLIGSAMAGTIGGFNAHAANIVTAVFLATGQDPAQNVESSNCITLMEETDDGDLWISCTMPSLEVGTVGGGTSLEAQASCLQAMGCKGAGQDFPGQNAQQLAKIIASATMAGELSLLSALAANTLVQAHMQHNRKKN